MQRRRNTRTGTPTQGRRRHLLAHQAHLHRTGAPRRRGAADRRSARHRHTRTAAPGSTCRASAACKVAPDLAFDTPNPGTAGATTFDDTFIFNGSMDRFDFKLVGKKEMYVPYNDYRAVYQSKQDDLVTPNHLNPDLVRWELHRVWVVEATLREGKRHVVQQAHVLPRRGLAGRHWLRTTTTRRASSTAPASPTWRRATTCRRRTPTCSATTTSTARIYSLTGYIAETGGLRQYKPLSRPRVDRRRAGRRRRPLTRGSAMSAKRCTIGGLALAVGARRPPAAWPVQPAQPPAWRSTCSTRRPCAARSRRARCSTGWRAPATAWSRSASAATLLLLRRRRRELAAGRSAGAART